MEKKKDNPVNPRGEYLKRGQTTQKREEGKKILNSVLLHLFVIWFFFHAKTPLPAKGAALSALQLHST